MLFEAAKQNAWDYTEHNAHFEQVVMQMLTRIL